MANLAALTSLQECLRNVCSGRSDCVAFSSDFDLLYQSSWVKPYNLAVDVTPQAVIRPDSTQEVAAIVQCAVDADVTVQARSGGHSYANFGLGDDAIVVDLVEMQQYSMNETTWYATIGAGMKLGDVDTFLDKTGRAFAHGVCPGVGIGGHATIVKSSACFRGASLLEDRHRLPTLTMDQFINLNRAALVPCRGCGALRLTISSKSKWSPPTGPLSEHTRGNTQISSL